MATAGGLVFYGTLDRKFKALNATTGAVKFSANLECGVVSAPISFTGPDGKQRVAITTGVGWLNGAFVGGACPAETSNVGNGDGGGGGGNGALAQAKAAVELGAAHPAAATPAVTSGYVHVFKLP